MISIVRLPGLQPADLGRRIALHAADAAVADLGKGEELANNQGPYVWSLTGRKTRGAWCAAAVYRWLLRGSASACAYLAIKRTHGARKLARRIRRHGRWIEPSRLPERGDVALWSRGPIGGWMGHVGIVEWVDPEMGEFRTIEGNRGKFPARVQRFTHRIGEKRLLGFARLW